jgi:aldehyde:ferredoxin oxidoreductase
MGADHTAGLVVNPGLTEDQLAQASQECQIVNAVCDSSGFCQFISPSIDLMKDYYTLMYGEEVTREQLGDQGWECLQDEWNFNTAAGWKDEDNGLSECLVEEGIGPDHAMKFDVSLDVINASKVRFDPREELYTAAASG